MINFSAAGLDRAGQVLWNWAGAALEVAFPVSCAVCEAPGSVLCRGCRMLLRRATIHAQCVDPPRGLTVPGVRVWAAGAYEHELASCLLAYKNGGRTDLAPVLSTVLTGVLVRAAAEIHAPRTPVLWVGVPTSARARWKRWFDPVQEILTRCSLPAGSRVRAGLKHRRRPFAAGASQKSLGVAQRSRAVRGTMCATDVRGATCVVVDDVMTSGATANEAVSVLREAGAHVPGVVVLATVRSVCSLGDDSACARAP